MTPHRSLSPRHIVSLLAQLQLTSKEYPPEQLAARRTAYLQQAASLPINPQALSGKAFKNIHKNFPKTLHAGITSTLETVVQSVLGIMVAGLVVTAAIVYRDEIVDFFTPDSGGAVSSEVAPLPSASTPTASSPTVAPLTPTTFNHLPYTATPTASFTPVPDGPQPTNDGTGKKLGHTATPPGQRNPQKP